MAFIQRDARDTFLLVFPCLSGFARICSPNYGEIVLPIITREKNLKSIAFQAAGVKKPLLSADKLNEAGR